MRAVAVVGGDGVGDQRALLLIEAGENGHRRIEREKAVERKTGVLANRRQRQRAMQQRVIGIANRRDRRQTIERAAQNDHHDARIARAGGADGPGVKAAAKETDSPRSAARREDRRGNEKPHDYLLWNSGDMNSSASACGRDSACKRASRVSREAARPQTKSSTPSGAP